MFLAETMEFTKSKPTFSFCSSSVLSVSSVRNAPAFSLIELLVAMAVTIVIVFMVTSMFRNASEAWDIGTQRAQMNTSARAALDLIARELSCAVAGSIPSSTGGVANVRPFTLDGGNDLRFTALSGEERTLRGILFRFDSNKRIIEMARSTERLPYETNVWDWPEPRLLITNVWRFEVSAYANIYCLTNAYASFVYKSFEPANANMLPVCVDIALEMLSEKDLKRALTLDNYGSDEDRNSPRYGYVMTNSRVYSTRVWFPNRDSR